MRADLKPWRQVACERLYTPQGIEMVIQTDMDSKRPIDQGRYLSKVCRAELTAWMWTKKTVTFIYKLLQIHRVTLAVLEYIFECQIKQSFTISNLVICHTKIEKSD